MARRRPYAARRQQESEIPHFDPEQREIAWKAVTVFRAMLPQLRAFARAISRNQDLDVAITTEKPYTKGNVIYIQPPMELGREQVHERSVCGRRAANGKQLCPACQVREVITFYVFHEIGHVYFNSQLPVTFRQERKLKKIAADWHPVGACEHLNEIEDAIRNSPKLNSMQLLSVFNQFLPMIFNCFEDTRVNEATFLARPGLRGIFDVNIERLMEEGSEAVSGEWRRWIDEPLDAQFMIGLYLMSSGHYVEGRLNADVVAALRTTEIEALCDMATSCTSAHEVFELSIEAFRAAQLLGYCVVPKCELIPQLPGQPSDEDEDGDSEEASDDSSSEDSEGSNSDKDDPAKEESSEDTDGSSSDSPSSDSDEEADSDSGASSKDDSEAGESSDDEEVNDESKDANDSGDDSESASDDTSGKGGSDSPEDDTESDDSETDAGDGTGSDGSNDEGERSESSGSVKSELGEDDSDGDGESPQGRSSESGQEEVRPGEPPESERELDDSERVDDGEASDAGGLGTGDDDVHPGSDDASEEYSDGEKEEDCDHVGEYECTKCGADLTMWDDDAWAEPGGDDMVPVDTSNDGPSGPVGDTKTSTPHHGTPDDAATALARFLMHPMGDGEAGGLLDDMAGGNAEEVVGASEHEAMEELLAKLIQVAATQSLFFEKDSGIVASVETVEYPNTLIRWDIQQMSREYRTSVTNILKSVLPSEDLIGRATQRMRRLFQDNLMTRRNRNLRSGRLDMRSLARRAPVQDDRLFGKKEKPRGKSHAVVIGIDCSGSTDGFERNLRIKRSAMAQAEVLNRLGVPWAGYAHTAFRTPLDHSFVFTSWEGPYYVYLLPFKKANEQWTDGGREKLSAVRALSENLDGHTLEQYINELLKMEGDEKILIYYTDGQMPAANYDEEREVLIEQCARAKKLGIHLIGVGINTDSPTQYGMETVEVNSDEDIMLVIDQLERILSR